MNDEMNDEMEETEESGELTVLDVGRWQIRKTMSGESWCRVVVCESFGFEMSDKVVSWGEWYKSGDSNQWVQINLERKAAGIKREFERQTFVSVETSFKEGKVEEV